MFSAMFIDDMFSDCFATDVALLANMADKLDLHIGLLLLFDNRRDPRIPMFFSMTFVNMLFHSLLANICFAT